MQIVSLSWGESEQIMVLIPRRIIVRASPNCTPRQLHMNLPLA
jgi:hypothetical protein